MDGTDMALDSFRVESPGFGDEWILRAGLECWAWLEQRGSRCTSFNLEFIVRPPPAPLHHRGLIAARQIIESSPSVTIVCLCAVLRISQASLYQTLVTTSILTPSIGKSVLIMVFGWIAKRWLAGTHGLERHSIPLPGNFQYKCARVLLLSPIHR